PVGLRGRPHGRLRESRHRAAHPHARAWIRIEARELASRLEAREALVPAQHAPPHETRAVIRIVAHHQHGAARAEAVEALDRLAHDWLVVTDDGLELLPEELLPEGLEELLDVVLELLVDCVDVPELDEVVVAWVDPAAAAFR